MIPETKIIAIDDDPTGSQTVHSCLLLTRWDPDTLIEALTDPAPLFFVLSNTRAMEAERAAAVTREICRNLRAALDRLGADSRPIHPLVVSRSDSTLRGHYPVETDIIAEELGPFDAHFLVPAFFEGGRITRAGVHYLMVDGTPVPVSKTEFARDSVFGYSTAYLPAYVEEKTGGALPAARVERFGLEELREGDLRPRLRSLRDNACGVVDAERQNDLDVFTRQILELVAGEGRRFLFRSAASLLTSFAGLPPQPVAAEAMGRFVRRGRPGVFLVGSHVPTSSRQLQHLLDHTDVAPVELELDRLQQDPGTLAREIDAALERAIGSGRSAVLYTSRGERQFADKAQRLAFGDAISDLLRERVRRLPADIGFLVSKGGITSNDVLSRGLALRTSRVLGQIQAGCSVVRCPADHARFPDLPVVIFPGNVGGETSLADIHAILTRDDSAVGPRRDAA
jgi:uncharacterized protein YgbK (DUF1537 family)